MLDIFTLYDISDIPNQIKIELSVFKRNKFEDHIITLFKMADRPLLLDEVLVGYYRLYRVIMTRRQITVKLYNMTRGKQILLKRLRSGLYTLK